MKPRFSCFLEAHQQSAAVPPREALIVNPRFWFQPASCIPPPLLRRADVRKGFLPGFPLAWIEDQRTSMLTPFWVPQKWASAVWNLIPSTSAPALEPVLGGVLCAASILIEPRLIEKGLTEWFATLTSARHQFAHSGYANLSGLLHPAQLRALGEYYLELRADNGLRFGDAQCTKRFAAHNEPLARFVHQQFTSLMEQVAGEPVLPSYAYFAGYCSGAALQRHLDREQCEFSVTLLVNYLPVPGVRSPWALWLDSPQGEVPIHQAIGDALFYRGRQLAHWRFPLAEGHSSDSMLLHYVPRAFTGLLR